MMAPTLLVAPGAGSPAQLTAASSAATRTGRPGPHCQRFGTEGAATLPQRHQSRQVAAALCATSLASRNNIGSGHHLSPNAFSRKNLLLDSRSAGGARWHQGRARRSLQVSAKDGGEGLQRVVSVAVRTGRQGLDAVTKFVPESVPRPVATAGVALTGVILVTWVAKALFSTLLSLLVVGGLGYAAFVYYTRDDGSDDDSGKGGSRGSSSEDSLDEARRIMEKYK